MAEPVAADPLVDVRARHQPVAAGGEGEFCTHDGAAWPCDVGLVLAAYNGLAAALDAERAENEQIIEDLGRDVDAAVVANEQLRERAERAEAAIARARVEAARNHRVDCAWMRSNIAPCTCNVGPVVAALERETP